jgi:mannosyl-3-phosphoglycerate phosphatase
MAKPLVFTDLDGTLLDHHTYSFDEALPMLAYFKSHKIPLIIVTSKTRAEVLKLQQRLGIEEPFIVENGAGAFVPLDMDFEDIRDRERKWGMISQSKPYEEVRRFILKVQERFGIRGFGDMDTEDVMRMTGLERAAAEDAMQRDFTEPFIMEQDKEVDELRVLAQEACLDIVQGGRFYHVITRGQDKGHVVKMVAALYERYYGEPVEVIALGDSANDLTMLDAADKAVQIPRPDGSFAELEVEGVIYAPYPGPKGWNRALEELFGVS